MRVRRQPDIAMLLRLSESVSLDKLMGEEDDGYSLAEAIAATEPPEDPNKLIEEELFQKLSPGNERTCIVLRSDGYTCEAISHITGLSENQVRTIIQNARSRLQTVPRQHVMQFRVWRTDTHQMLFAGDPSALSPIEHLGNHPADDPGASSIGGALSDGAA